MEIVPFAWWLVVTARVSAEWHDRREHSAPPRELAVLLLLGTSGTLRAARGSLAQCHRRWDLFSLRPEVEVAPLPLCHCSGWRFRGFVNFAFTGTAQ